MKHRGILGFVFLVCAGCVTNQDSHDKSAGAALWNAIENVAETSILDRSDVERLLGARLEIDTRRQVYSASIVEFFFSRNVRMWPFSEASYELARQLPANITMYAGEPGFIAASAKLTLWINEDSCQGSAEIYRRIDPGTAVPVQTEQSQSDRAVSSAISFVIDGRRVVFGFSEHEPDDCLRFVEIEQQSPPEDANS
jgi:hypothetical protein